MNTDPNKDAADMKVLPEVTKAINFWMDKTYNESEFYSHVLAIIRDNSGNCDAERAQMERLMFKVEELREAQRLYHGGHKGKLSECKRLETEIDKKILGLKSKGYSTDRFKVIVEQKQFF